MGEHAGPAAAPGGRAPARPGRMGAPWGPLAAPPARLIAQLLQLRGHRGQWRGHLGWVRGHMVRVMADGTTNQKRHRVVTARMVVASVLVGVVLAVGSVPYGTLVAELRLRDPLSRWVGDRLPGPTRSTGVLWQTHSHPRYPDLGPEYLAQVPPFIDTLHIYPSFEPAADGVVPSAAVRAARRGGDWLDVYWSGFPFRAAVGWWSEPSGSSENLIRRTTQTPRGHTRAWAIPLRPIWPGLLGNAVFYTALLLVPLAVVRLVRTRRRRARGRCVACGYELGPTLERGVGVCPECGLAARALFRGADENAR